MATQIELFRKIMFISDTISTNDNEEKNMKDLDMNTLIETNTPEKKKSNINEKIIENLVPGEVNIENQ